MFSPYKLNICRHQANSIYVIDKEIQYTDFFTYLGAIIDSKLKLYKHRLKVSLR